MLYKKNFTPKVALEKIKQFCTYQERCHTEVKDKLYSFGLYKTDVETIISTLIEDNYLNEERFAKLFAGGKFRMKQWGRKKIVYELQQKRISPYCIKAGLKEIDEEEYAGVLNKLALKKWNSLKGEQYLARMAKTHAYLMQKGYEPNLISAAIQSIRENQ